VKCLTLMIEADHHPSLHADFGKFLPKLASYVNYLFAHFDPKKCIWWKIFTLFL